jgi:hypothetical protein
MCQQGGRERAEQTQTQTHPLPEGGDVDKTAYERRQGRKEGGKGSHEQWGDGVLRLSHASPEHRGSWELERAWRALATVGATSTPAEYRHGPWA